MKKSAIREMLLGNRGTLNNISDSDYHNIADEKMNKAVDGFLAKLSLELTKDFTNVYDVISEKGDEFALDHYIEGFKFGLLIGIEVGENQ